jgi:methyltransferase (TIGR00027 family)
MTKAVSPPLPSRTSIWAAGARALGARQADPQLRNPDVLADRLIGPEELALLGEHPLRAALEQRTPEAAEHPEARSAMATLTVRTKFIDERLTAAIHAGAAQLVILGAGWDTRAYRLADLLRGVRIFEIDQPVTQNWKRRRAEQVLGPPPANLTYLNTDFRAQTLGDVLAATAYNPAQPTFFLWEGVTMYLPEEAVRATLRWIAQQAPGSRVVFDFAYRSVIEWLARARDYAGPLPEAAKLGMDRLRQIAAWGEPWIFGVPDHGEREFVTALGLEHQKTLAMASPEAARRYLGWDESRPLPGAIRQMYAILEAAVPAA